MNTNDLTTKILEKIKKYNFTIKCESTGYRPSVKVEREIILFIEREICKIKRPYLYKIVEWQTNMYGELGEELAIHFVISEVIKSILENAPIRFTALEDWGKIQTDMIFCGMLK